MNGGASRHDKNRTVKQKQSETRASWQVIIIIIIIVIMVI
jgi:hypothetical protein